MSTDLIDEIVRIKGIPRRDLLEKDFLLHRILRHLTNDGWFSARFLFKGGTCLIKCHLGYYRFSEDIDFTYRNQNDFEGLSMKETRRRLSDTIDQLGGLLEKIAKAENLEFRCDKKDRSFVELGGSNKFCTFKLWYNSTIGVRSFVKAQFNFVEKLCYTPIRVQASNALGESVQEVVALYPEAALYFEPLELWSYDPKEILCEKVRAILTRRGVKARDYVDLFMMKDKLSLEVREALDCISKKIIHMLTHYKKYRKNLEIKRRLLTTGSLFNWGNEQALLLVPMNTPRFYSFVEDLESILREILIQQ